MRRGILKSVEEKGRMRLRFALSSRGICQKALILIGHSDVMHPPHAQRIKPRSRLRIGVVKPGDLRWIRIIQVREHSRCSHHLVEAELVGQSNTARIAKAAGSRRDHGKVW